MKPIVLCILDGVGINNDKNHNAVALANMPFFNKLLKKYPNSKLKASGNAVGLPDGIMGNSEVGHITICSGRIVNQFLRRFEIEDLSKNKPLNDFVKSVKKDGGIVHDFVIYFDILKNGSIEKAAFQCRKQENAQVMIGNITEDSIQQRKRLESFFDEELITWTKEIMQQYNRLMAY